MVWNKAHTVIMRIIPQIPNQNARATRGSGIKMYTLSLHANVFLPYTHYMYNNNSNPYELRPHDMDVINYAVGKITNLNPTLHVRKKQ